MRKKGLAYLLTAAMLLGQFTPVYAAKEQLIVEETAEQTPEGTTAQEVQEETPEETTAPEEAPEETLPETGDGGLSDQTDQMTSEAETAANAETESDSTSTSEDSNPAETPQTGETADSSAEFEDDEEQLIDVSVEDSEGLEEQTELAVDIDPMASDDEDEEDEDEETSGYCGYASEDAEDYGENLQWELVGSTLVITGSGDMYNWEGNAEFAPWYEYTDEIYWISLPSGLTSIGDFAFADCDQVSSVAVPTSVFTIGNYAFENCTSLWQVAFDSGSGLHTVGDGAFSGCDSLTLLTLPGAVTSIGAFALQGTALYKFEVPPTVTELQDSVFMDCAELKSVELSNSLKTIGDDVFFGCAALTEITFPDELTAIGERAFEGCSSLEQIYFSEEKKLTTIGNEAFKGCKALKRVWVPDGVTSIGEEAFAECDALVSAVLHEDVAKIGEDAFGTQTSLFGYDAEEETYVEQYAAANNLSYTKLDRVQRSADGFCAALDGWCLTNSPELYGGSTMISAELFYDTYGITLSSVVNSVVTGIYNKTLKKWLDGVDGRCFGFSLLAAANYDGKINLENYFDRSGDGLNVYGYDEIVTLEAYPQQQFFSIQNNETVKKLLDQTALSQKSQEFKETEVFEWDSDYSGLIEYISSGERAPLVVTLETISGFMHAVVLDTTYENLYQDGDAYWIPVYDPNTPYITTHLDTPGSTYTGTNSSWTMTAANTYLVLDTGTGEWKLVENGAVSAESGYYFFGVDVRSICFYDVSNLPDYYFTGELSLWLGDKATVFVRNKINGSVGGLNDFSLTGTDGEDLLTFAGGSVTSQSESISITDVEVSDGVVTGLELEVPKQAFYCSGTGVGVLIAGTEGYLYAGANGTASFLLDPVAVSCQVSAAEATDTVVELQKTTGDQTYMAASFSGQVQDEANFSISSDHSAAATATNPELTFQVAVDDGATTAEYAELKVKDAASIDPSVPITPSDSDQEQTHVHLPGDWTTERAATCTEQGSQVKICTVAGCGEVVERQTIPALGHSYGAWTTKTAATALAQGTQVRTCTRGCGAQETQTIAKLKATITLNATSFPLKVKQSTTALKVSGLASGDYVASWTSNKPTIVSVTKTGKNKAKITAKKKTGSATITIKLASGLTKKVTVKVQKSAVKTTKISGLKKKVTLKKGQKLTLKPTITPITTKDKTKYSSSAKKVATVSSKGVITAKKAGKAKITVSSGKKKFVVTVTVK